MAFASLLQSQVQNAMKIIGTDAGELAAGQTYASVDTGTSAYDTATGTFTIAETLYTNVPMVLPKFAEGEIDGNNIERTDLKAIIANADLSVTPKVQDRIYLANGSNYLVKRVMSVPGDSVYILHLGETE